jgi:hypothetical protein
LPSTIAYMDRAPDLRPCAHWRLAVWGLRVIFFGLAVVVVGLVTLAWSTGAGQAILAVGMGIYLVGGVPVCVVGILRVYREVPPPRPNFLDLRWTLIHDALHAKPTGGQEPVEGPAQAPEELRRSTYWRPAVWGVRAMGPGLVMVIAGFVTLAWSGAGIALLAIGAGIWVVGMAFTLVELHLAYEELEPPRPRHSRVQHDLLHDARHGIG